MRPNCEARGVGNNFPTTLPPTHDRRIFLMGQVGYKRWTYMIVSHCGYSLELDIAMIKCAMILPWSFCCFQSPEFSCKNQSCLSFRGSLFLSLSRLFVSSHPACLIINDFNSQVFNFNLAFKLNFRNFVCLIYGRALWGFLVFFVCCCCCWS